MPEPTYLELVLDHFAGSGEAVNAALTEAGLPPLVDWYRGQPRPTRTDNTPYAWVAWDGRGADGAWDGLPTIEHAVHVLVMLMLAGSDPGDLADQVAAYVPRVQAALERQPGPYWVAGLGWEPIEADQGPLGIYALTFRVRVDRTHREVS